MNYKIYKLHFSAPVHFGKNALSDAEYSICSDTLFSALCSEAVCAGESALTDLVNKTQLGNIQFSDALPYIEGKYLLPKPYTFVERKQNIDSSVIRKAFKNLKYISSADYDDYLNGSFDVMSATSISELGVSALKVSVSLRNDDQESMPYEVGTFAFNPNCGLYVIVGFEDAECESFFDTLMQSLSSSGLGGKRSSGYGRFSFEKGMPDAWFVEKLTGTASSCMLINTALPNEDELESVLEGARYSLIKRSGYVASTTYSDSWQRKKDLVMFKAGSCFAKVFEGDIYDVSTDAGSHPVYRCGKPMFMRISL